MISGEYEIKSNKLDDITGTERTMTLEVKESIESKWSPIKLSKRSMEILENKKKE